jgi:hypothetical protein
MTTGSSADTYVEGDDFDDREFRRGVWRQTLTSVALVTVSASGRNNVMACEWAMMVSHAPMFFTISVHPRNATHDLLVEAGEFGLSFCSDTQAHLSHVSGSNSLHDVDKWRLADFPTYPAKRIGAPMIDDAALNVECRTVPPTGSVTRCSSARWSGPATTPPSRCSSSTAGSTSRSERRCRRRSRRSGIA